MKMRRYASGLFVAVLAAALLPVTSDSARGTPPPAGFRVDWAPCPESPVTQCGMLHVPVDWSKPRGPQITVAVARRPADDPRRRVGTLFFNPGGPGDGAAGDVIDAEKIFSAALRARFDLVGMDPRGVGASARIRCSVPVLTPADTLFPSSEQQFRELRRHNRALGLSCLRETGLKLVT